MADLGILRNPNKALWEKGDFTRIAQTMRQSGDALVATLDVHPGMKVLDLGCGDGTTAVPAAERGADVLGIDIADNLVAAGIARAKALGLGNLRFQQGDASRLVGVEDESFDLVVSIFGAMFAPNPTEVAREMVRVTKPGGGIVMGNWIPGDPTLVAQILKICARYLPPPEGSISPMLWGSEAVVRERFETAGISPSSIKFERASWVFRTSEPPSELFAIFRDFYGPTMNAFEAASRDGLVLELARELNALFKAQNRGGERTEIPATYLKVLVTKS